MNDDEKTQPHHEIPTDPLPPPGEDDETLALERSNPPSLEETLLRKILSRLNSLSDEMHSPHGPMTRLRGEIAALRTQFDVRDRRDSANWDFVKREVSGTRLEMRERLDAVERDVRDLSQRVGKLEQQRLQQQPEPERQ